MPLSELTAVERGALFVLMAEARPLKENAELRKIHGVDLDARHRAKLQRLGLIKTTKSPLTHALTEKGWEWAKAELSAERPTGQLGFGPLYAVLRGVRKHLGRSGLDLGDVFSAKRDDSVGRRDMARAAWSDADESLAQALQDMSVFDQALKKLQDAAPAQIADLVRRTALASDLVLQHVHQAARRRQLAFATEEGKETAYDPVLHRAEEKLKLGAAVKIRKAPVIRGPVKLGVVVLVGEVEPV